MSKDPAAPGQAGREQTREETRADEASGGPQRRQDDVTRTRKRSHLRSLAWVFIALLILGILAGLLFAWLRPD